MSAPARKPVTPRKKKAPPPPTMGETIRGAVDKVRGARLRWWVLLGIVTVCATVQGGQEATRAAADAASRPPVVVTVPVYLPPVVTTAPGPIVAPTTTTSVAPGPPTTAPAPAPSVIQEDDPRWDCRTMGNHVCGTTTTAPATESAQRGACLRTTFTDGSFVNVRRTGDNTFERC